MTTITGDWTPYLVARPTEGRSIPQRYFEQQQARAKAPTFKGTRAGVRAALGEPTRTSDDDGWELYELDGYVAHFEHDDEGAGHSRDARPRQLTPQACVFARLHDLGGCLPVPGGGPRLFRRYRTSGRVIGAVAVERMGRGLR
ncbi:hypothetical protein ACF3NT_05410 [Naumannella halotolerans]|uniref:Uncharacterized protein n=1 Tax=Naumannella halotolerans TaxID=993414 RepID=A0A4R7J7Q2_9ACTN|nr:hypothetical protein [Naumannella halotolerans]TDT33481.1 hypothetical protein CLV29_1099 [Naumannella halotolerans]